MKDIDFGSMSSMINLAKQILTIIKKDYSNFLSSEKLDFCENFNDSNIRFENKQNKPPIYFENDIIYLNDYYKEIKKEELLILILMISLCGELNPLKFGLILKEVKTISDNYNIRIFDVNNIKEFELASLIKDKFLDDLGFNIIFFDSDIEIFYYLTEEKGIRIAKLYYELSKKMSLKFKDYNMNEFNLNDFLAFYNKIDYQDIYDFIYEFISINIK